MLNTYKKWIKSILVLSGCIFLLGPGYASDKEISCSSGNLSSQEKNACDICKIKPEGQIPAGEESSSCHQGNSQYILSGNEGRDLSFSRPTQITLTVVTPEPPGKEMFAKIRPGSHRLVGCSVRPKKWGTRIRVEFFKNGQLESSKSEKTFTFSMFPGDSLKLTNPSAHAACVEDLTFFVKPEPKPEPKPKPEPTPE